MGSIYSIYTPKIHEYSVLVNNIINEQKALSYSSRIWLISRLLFFKKVTDKGQTLRNVNPQEARQKKSGEILFLPF
jgi:hypothetical protein